MPDNLYEQMIDNDEIWFEYAPGWAMSISDTAWDKVYMDC